MNWFHDLTNRIEGYAWGRCQTMLVLTTLFAFATAHVATAQALSDLASLVDEEDNTYRTVRIGNGVWIAENLNAGSFTNGDVVSEATTAAHGNERGLCPTGLQVLIDQEWKQVEPRLGLTEQDVDACSWRGSVDGRLKSSRIALYAHPRRDVPNVGRDK